MYWVIIVVLILLFLTYETFYTGPHPLRDPGRIWVNQPCLDKDSRCALWAAGHECKRNPEWMFENCPTSCGVYHMNEDQKNLAIVESRTFDRRKNITPCASTAGKEQCEKWTLKGWCKQYPYFMANNCPEECGVCKYIF